MKQILFALLLLPAVLSSQQITNDSTYLTWQSADSAWFRVIVITYDNGNTDQFKRLIGDTATLFNQSVDGIRSRTSSLATDVSITSAYAKQVRTLIRESDEIAAKAGLNPSDSIETKDAAQFLEPGWTIKNGGASVPITFNQQASGRLRYQYTTTTNRQTDLLGSVIRLRDFPTTGTVTDFYRFPNGRRWVTLDRSFQLIPPGGTAANR